MVLAYRLNEEYSEEGDSSGVPQHRVLRRGLVRHQVGGPAHHREAARRARASPTPPCSPGSSPTPRATTRSSCPTGRSSAGAKTLDARSRRGTSRRPRPSSPAPAAADGQAGAGRPAAAELLGRGGPAPAARRPAARRHGAGAPRDLLRGRAEGAHDARSVAQVQAQAAVNARGCREARASRPRWSPSSPRPVSCGRWSAARGSSRTSTTSPPYPPGQQAGSAWKVITLAAALESGYSPNDIVSGTSPCTVPSGQGYCDPGRPGRVTTRNAEGGGGTMTIRRATAGSVNCAVRAHLGLGRVRPGHRDRPPARHQAGPRAHGRGRGLVPGPHTGADPRGVRVDAARDGDGHRHDRQQR